MIPHNFLKCKIKMTKSFPPKADLSTTEITPRAGIPLISAIAHSIGVPRLPEVWVLRLEEKLSSLKKRNRGYYHPAYSFSGSFVDKRR
jgi:hypothetical protein